MQHLARGVSRGYALDGTLEPVLWVDPGEPFSVETEDASTGTMHEGLSPEEVESLPYRQHQPPRSNPVVGPIAIRGVEPGDVVVVEVEDLEVDATGFSAIRPGVGPFGDSARYPMAPRVVTIHHQPGPEGRRATGTSRMGRYAWPTRPMIGTLALAPEREVLSSAEGQGPFGGNLDVSDLTAGSRIWLQAYRPHGLLFVGDVHGGQGDTEYYGTADEAAGRAVLRAHVLPKRRIPYPRLETVDRLVALFSARPVEAAIHGAMENLMDWLAPEVPHEDLYVLASVSPEVQVRVYQMVDWGRGRFSHLLPTVGVSVPRPWAPGCAFAP